MGGKLQPLASEKRAANDGLRTGVSVVDAARLLGDAGELAILHGGDTYRLVRTRQNKLLLTKCRNIDTFESAPRQDNQL